MPIRHQHIAILLFVFSTMTACIEPPLNLAGRTMLVDLPIVETELEVVWNLDIDWQADWHYGWDLIDSSLFGPIAYPEPTNFEVRRYYLGQEPGLAHTWDGRDAFTIYGNRFRRYYHFGYYDMLIWSNIDSKDGTQTVVIDENDIDNVIATTTGTRGMTRIAANVLEAADTSTVVGLYNQPEIFYSTYPQDVFISRQKEDYDYYDSINQVYVKRINATLRPIVYIYLVQIIIYNNEDGRIRGVSGNNAISSLASTSNVNTGRSGNSPCLVYFGSRMKRNLDVHGRRTDIIGGMLTTYGLCDMESYAVSRGAPYQGSRADLNNILYFDLDFINGVTSTYQVDVTDQMQAQSHGGIITVELDAHDIKVPDSGGGSDGSLFVPTVEDYDEVIWDIEM